MPDEKPRLLVLGGPHVDPEALAGVLSDVYELVAVPADASLNVLGEGYDAVLADVEDVAAVQRPPTESLANLLLNTVGEGLTMTDEHGAFVWSNQMFLDLDETVRKRIGEVCAHALTLFRDRVATTDGRRPRKKRYLLSFNKSDRHFEVLVSPVMSGEGETLERVAAAVREVTSRFRIERKMEALDRAGRELVHFDAETVKRMHVAERLRLLEERVVRFARELLNFEHFAVRLVNPETRRLDLVMASGLPPEAVELELYAEEEGNGISGYVAATGHSYRCDRAAADPRYMFGLDEPGSSLTVPLKLYDKTIGVFNVESSQPAAFTEQDRQFAELFGHYIAMALHILNLLLVERYTTNEAATGVVEGELSEPLNDLLSEAKWLLKEQGENEEAVKHIERILGDVQAIRRRIKNVSRGPQTLLGVEEAIARKKPDPLLQGRRVLVADDEETIVKTIRDILRNRGCDVVICTNGEQAVRELEAWAKGGEGFDLVVTDINLGDRTGYDVFAAAKAASEEVPVIMMTGFGYDPHHSIVRASQEGLQCVLFKPFQAKKFVEECRSAIRHEECDEGPEGE